MTSEEFTNIVPKRKWKFGDLIIKSKKLKELFGNDWQLNIQYKGSIDVRIDGSNGDIILNLKKEIKKPGAKKRSYIENATE